MDLVNFLKVLLRRKWLILFISLTATVAAFYITRLMPQAYSSSAQLATGFTDNAVDDDGKIIQPFKIENQFNNILEILNSRKLVNLLSYQLVIHDLESDSPYRNPNNLYLEFNESDLQKALEAFKLKLEARESLSTSKKEDRLLIDILKVQKYDYEKMMEGFEVSRVAGTDFIQIKFKSENPFLSAFAVNTLANEFVHYYKVVQSEGAAKSVNFYSQVADKRKKELDEKVDVLKQYKLKNNIVNIEEQIRSMVMHIRSLEIEREEENKKIPSIENAISKIDLKFKNRDGYAEAQNSIHNSKILELKNKITRLNDAYISSGLQDKSALDSVNFYKVELEKEIHLSAKESVFNPNVARDELVLRRINLELELEIAKASKLSLEEELERLNVKISKFAEQEAIIDAYEREIEVASNSYLSALDKLNAARFATMSSGTLLRQVEFGDPADDPEPSKKMMLVGMAGIASMALCIVVLFVMEYIDSSLRSPVEFYKYTNLELSGTLNLIPPKKLKLLSENNETIDSDIELHNQALKKIRHEVESSGAKIFLVTSTKAGEGKSFLISSLAHVLSLNESKILIVDTNFKNNTITQTYNAKPVLGKFLNQEVGNEQMVSPSGKPNIDVMGCEGGNYSPSEIFAYINIRQILKDLSNSYNYIFLEGAALNDYSDTRELVQYVDMIIPVFSASSEIKLEDERSIDYLMAFKDKLLGSVLNSIKKS